MRGEYGASAAWPTLLTCDKSFYITLKIPEADTHVEHDTSAQVSVNCSFGVGGIVKLPNSVQCRCKIKFWPPYWISTRGQYSMDFSLNCDPPYLLNFDHAVEFWHHLESQFHRQKICRRVRIPRWIVTRGQNSTLNFDPGSEFHIELWPQAQVTIQCLIKTPGQNWTWNSDLGSYFNVESRPGVTFQRGIMTRDRISTWNLESGNNSTWNHYLGSHFNVELWPGVTIQRGIITPGQNSTLNHDPGSEFQIELWSKSRVII